MAKEKVNYQEVYDLYQLCCETKDLRRVLCGLWSELRQVHELQRHQLWSEKLGKTVRWNSPR